MKHNFPLPDDSTSISTEAFFSRMMETLSYGVYGLHNTNWDEDVFSLQLLNQHFHCYVEYSLLLDRITYQGIKTDFSITKQHLLTCCEELIELMNSHFYSHPSPSLIDRLCMMDTYITMTKLSPQHTYYQEINETIVQLEESKERFHTENTVVLIQCIPYLVSLYHFLDIPWLPTLIGQCGAELHSRYRNFHKVAHRYVKNYITPISQLIIALQECYSLTDLEIFRETGENLFFLLQSTPLFHYLYKQEVKNQPALPIRLSDVLYLTQLMLYIENQQIHHCSYLFCTLQDDLKFFKTVDQELLLFSQIYYETTANEKIKEPFPCEYKDWVLFCNTWLSVIKALY